MNPLYFDHAATTPVDPVVAETMLAALRLANPASPHAAGREAAIQVEAARARVAARVGARPEELTWTSGATEADNLAILGSQSLDDPGHIVCARTEHKAVLDPVRQLERAGWRVSWLKPGADAVVDAATVLDAVRPDTRLVTVMHVNNETGAVQDIGRIGQALADHPAVFHVDAAQSLAWLPIDVQAMGIDLLALSAHKCHGPAGVGALVHRRGRARLRPLLFGGGQERGLRPGTLPVHQLLGFAKAVERLDADPDAPARVARLRERLWAGLADVGGVLRNGDRETCAPHILNVTLTGVQGESLVYSLPDVLMSQGSACTAGGDEASYVLRALGRSDAEARASLRLSLGRGTTAADVDAVGQRICAAVRRLRGLAPLCPTMQRSA